MNSTDPLEAKPCVGSCEALRPSELAFGDMAAQAHETTMPGAHPEHLILRSLPNTCLVIGVLKHRSPTERGTVTCYCLVGGNDRGRQEGTG